MNVTSISMSSTPKEMPLTTGQTLAIILCVLASGTLSVGGSASIIMALRGKLNTTFSRLMVGLCMADIVTTLAQINMTWALPKETESLFAVGNIMTCSAAGFFLLFFLGSAAYSACISLYFLLTVKCNYSEKDFRFLEPTFHAVAWFSPLILGTVGLFLEGFNVPHLGRMCFFSAGPPSCKGYNRPDCTRGFYTFRLGLTFAVFSFACALLGITNTILLHRTIRRTHSSSMRHSFDGKVSGSIERRKRQSLQQSVLYVTAYMNSFIWFISVGALSDLIPYSTLRQPARIRLFVPILLSHIFVPLQGFLNAIIFFVPRIQHWLKVCPEQSIQWSFRQVLMGKEAPRRRLRSSASCSVFIMESGTPRSQRSGLVTGVRSFDAEMNTNGEGGPTEIIAKETRHDAISPPQPGETETMGDSTFEAFLQEVLAENDSMPTLQKSSSTFGAE